MANPILTYEAKIIQGGVDLRVEGGGTPNIAAIYGDYINSGTTKIADCRIAISYRNISWTLNPDNSVTVTGEITGDTLVRTATGTSSAGVTWGIEVDFNNNRTFTQTVGDTSGTYNLNIPDTFNVTIPPLTTSSVVAIHYKNYPVGYSFAADEFTLGLHIQNPNLPDYRPGAIRDSEGKWLSHNRSGGEAHILNGSWREMRTDDGHGSNDNPPSIRLGDKWTNQLKLGKQ